MTTKEMLAKMIDEAWEQYVIIHKAEIESGYDDAMDGFERKEAEAGCANTWRESHSAGAAGQPEEAPPPFFFTCYKHYTGGAAKQQ